MKKIVRASSFFLLATLAACATPEEQSQELAFTPVNYSTLNGWAQETPESLLPILRDECQRIERLPFETRLGGVPDFIRNGSLAGEWRGACEALRAVPNEAQAARTYFETWFVPYAINANAFYTGYYEPLVYASAQRGGEFQTPIYAKPADLVRARDTSGNWVNGRWQGQQFKPYYSRAEIDRGALAGQGLELAWLRSPEDLFFLQIQGSGRLFMTDGSTRRVGFAARNGQAYVPIGRVLVQQGELASNQVNMTTIRNWLAAHPDRAQAVLEQNPNYVFFRNISDISLDRGAPGALGVPLTPGRSLAVDRKTIPLGVPIWVETRLPDAQGHIGDWRHLTFAQDIGTDIKGAGRADLFTGWGPMAEMVAGNLHEHGRMIVLLPRPPA
ncbi:murein transglycosylase A [Kozakia baliensis]|uniref:peptidoglycan lytic exotransglycosylase n=1 Tax=Kozakia baliensis TaxID=153496 RepID=A0A1D8URW9_9PROT|nr:MltA domain-containing protein [Kozakia baliensis]AOX16381.1 murein transglycosylase [Kozakia baliensis]GBR28793.1 membrane-bound lytic murein transglycosylase [Kozakia baliensis NRIC 0488]GEL63546.1 murein transglycosylase [Kozakia baliensis]